MRNQCTFRKVMPPSLLKNVLMKELNRSGNVSLPNLKGGAASIKVRRCCWSVTAQRAVRLNTVGVLNGNGAFAREHHSKSVHNGTRRWRGPGVLLGGRITIPTSKRRVKLSFKCDNIDIGIYWWYPSSALIPSSFKYQQMAQQAAVIRRSLQYTGNTASTPHETCRRRRANQAYVRTPLSAAIWWLFYCHVDSRRSVRHRHYYQLPACQYCRSVHDEDAKPVDIPG